MSKTTTSASTLPSTGDFYSGALASGRRLDINQFLTDEPLLGLQREAGYIWGTLRDDDGELYSIMRRIDYKPADDSFGSVSLGGKLILVSTGDNGEGLQLRREPRSAADSATITRARDGDGALWTGPGTDTRRATTIRMTADSLNYVEDGVADLTGSIAAPALQWYLPGPESALLYLTQTWLVEGELVGKHVRGFIFWEEAWMPEGGRLYIDKDPLHDAGYTTWYSWANLWEDGSTEVGHFLFGQKDFHVGVSAHSDGTVRSAHSMDAVVRRADDGYWHAGIDYDLDGEKWVCEADPRGHMRGLGTVPNPQQEGRIHRVDDTRKPVVWMAWGESVPAAGESRHQD